jgi:hypothetical protein
MALECNAKKPEHNGAKNRGHDKTAHRADLKASAKKLRRVASRRMEQEGKIGGERAKMC